MPFQTPASKSNGSTITRAELIDLLENLEWFRTPPAYRVYSRGNETVTTTLSAMDFSPSSLWHPEWREGGGGDPNDNTYDSGTGGLWVNVGDVEPGVWINGVMFAIQQPSSAYASYVTRRVQLRRGDGSTWTELADWNVRGDVELRRTSCHIHGVGTFNNSTDRVEVRARTAFGSLNVVGDRRWGVRFGSSAAWADSYAAARQVSDTNNELTGAWNRLRNNQLRIERRPSGQKYKTGSNQAISAGTVTLVTMGAEDWDTDTGMSTSASPNRLVAQQGGIYFMWSQATFVDLDSSAALAAIAIERDGTANIVTANAPGQLATSEDATVTVCDLTALSTGQYIQTNVQTSIGSTVEASRGTQMHMTMLSSNSGVSPGRQVFDRMPDPSTWPDVTDMSSSHCPAGTLRVLSDLTDRQWHRPAFKASLGDDVELDDGKWTDVDCDQIVFDYTDLEEEWGYSIFTGGGLHLPWPGLWLVGARLQIGATTAEGVNRGNVGNRGMRIALGEGRAVGAIIGPAMGASSHSWVRTIAETVVVNSVDGLDVKLQGLASSGTDEFGAALAIDAHLWAVELGEGITRVPR
jgi:hypothetical protein